MTRMKTFRIQLMKFGPMALLMSLAAVGCSEPERVAQRVAVSGRVTLDGQPVKTGAIVFRVRTGNEEGSLLTAHGLVENGRYRIDAQQGPAVGKAKVEFWPKPLSREQLELALETSRGSYRPEQPTVFAIPDKYGADSEIEVQLSAGQENRHDFTLDSRR